MVKCEECGRESEERKKLHYHLRTHKLSQEEYYHKHFPRIDLYTGEILSYKNYDDYTNKFFEKKGNLSKYIKENPKMKVRQVLGKMLKSRSEQKKLVWEMSDVELRSLEWPSKKQLENIYGEEGSLFENLNARYKNHSDFQLKNDCGKIFIDTREQKPFNFKDCEVEVTALNFGDYAAEIDGRESSLHVERKSLMDFIQSFSSRSIDRLEKEFQRAEVCGKSILVLVEKDLNSVVTFDRMPRTMKFVRATPQHILHNVREVIQSYRNVQFLFVKDKISAKQICKTVLLNEHLFEYDLQYLYNSKLLNVG